MNTSEVLYKAADHIERFGHHKGSGFGGHPAFTAPACTIGAITVAGMCDEHGATAALMDYLGNTIVDWNDAPDRTAEQVIEALRAAAVIEAAKESADDRERVTA